MPNCRHCGHMIGPNAQRCPGCGATTDYHAKGTIVGCLAIPAAIVGAIVGQLIDPTWGAFWGAGVGLAAAIGAGVWWTSRP